MKKTLFTTITAASIGFASAQATFSVDPAFSAGDSSVSFNVTGSSSGTGVLTVTTSRPAGFTGAISSGPNLAGRGAGLNFREVSQDFTFSYVGDGITTTVLNSWSSIGTVGGVSLAGGIISVNTNGGFEEGNSSNVFAIGDSTDGVILSGNNVSASIGFLGATTSALTDYSYAGGNNASATFGVNFDIDAVPEPSSALLLGLGGLGFLARRKRA